MLPFFPRNRALRPEGLLHSRGIARSGLRPLTKIPYCCLPQESGPCLSPSVAGRPLRPATDRCFGKPLPHQPANQSSAAPLARGPCGSPSFFRRTHAVLANLSAGCPPRADTFRCITHPFATRRRREASFSPRYRSTCMCKAFRQRSI